MTECTDMIRSQTQTRSVWWRASASSGMILIRRKLLPYTLCVMHMVRARL